MTDQEVIWQLKYEPETGLLRLLEEYRGLAAIIAGRVLSKRREEIEECVQDAFLAIWRNASSLNPKKGSLKGLVIRTVRNKAIDRYRTLRRKDCLSLEEMGLADELDIQSDLLAKERAETLEAAIATLPEPSRSILLRRYYLFESVAEIARALTLTSKQVENRLYQAKLRLRTQLTEKGVTL